MRLRYRTAVIGLLGLAAWFAADFPIAHAQSADDLFNPDTLQEVRLFINSKDLAFLKAHIFENIFVPADFVWRGTRIRNVAVRSRGFGSRTPQKLGLLVDFDHYTTGQKFLGLKALVLKNLWQDRAMIREKVAFGLYDRMGLPVPRESFGRVIINNVDQGLYGIVENLDEEYLNRVRGESAGYLFEYHYVSRWGGEYLGDSLDPYKPMFEPRTHDDSVDTVLYSPIRDMVREINAPVDGVWRDRVEQLIDVKQFLTILATDVCLAEADGLAGEFGTANFFLYRPADATRHQVLVWDRDHSMWNDFTSSIFLRTNEHVLFNQAMQFSEYYDHYLNELQRCAERAAEDSWLETEIAKRAALVNDAAHADTHKQFTNEEYDAQLPQLMEFAQKRSAFVRAEVAKARAARASGR